MVDRRNLRRDVPTPRPMTDAEQARSYAGRIAGCTPGSRTWDLVLNAVAADRCEVAVIEALAASLDALRTDVITWEKA